MCEAIDLILVVLTDLEQLVFIHMLLFNYYYQIKLVINPSSGQKRSY